MNINTQTKKHVRFRRFTKKAYAVFCSLHKVISIGRLSADTSDCSLRVLTKKLATDYLQKQNFAEQEVDFETSMQETDFPNPAFAFILPLNHNQTEKKGVNISICVYQL
ncbi:MAG: hypothetical protein LBT04_04525 [Prevotellaceae bacterium]|nr:hypothetical protein [Prevotellaceae bacterium]